MSIVRQSYIYKGFEGFLNSDQIMFIAFNTKAYFENKLRRKAYLEGVGIEIKKLKLLDPKKPTDLGVDILLIQKSGVNYVAEAKRFVKKSENPRKKEAAKTLAKMIFLHDRGFSQGEIAKKIKKSQAYVSVAIKKNKRKFSIVPKIKPKK